jgi:hypothetical protein
MKKICWLLFVLAAPAFAATYTVPAFTSASIQSTVNTAAGAGSGNTVFLPAGQYSISSTVNLPCNVNLTVTGPVANPATAVLSATASGYSIFGSGSCTGITVTYLQFRNNSGIYFSGNSNNSGIVITNNQFLNLPSQACTTGVTTCKQNYTPGNSAVFLDGYLSSSVSNNTLAQVTNNVTITNNTFGDATSCTAVFNQADDNGGTCAGITMHTGTASNIFIRNNLFYHLEEPIHFSQLNGGFNPPATESVSDNVHIEYNYFLNYMRIGTEIQTGVVNHSLFFQHNVVQDPPTPTYGTYATSFACCTAGFNQGASGYDPSLIFNDNVLITSIGSRCPPYRGRRVPIA